MNKHKEIDILEFDADRARENYEQKENKELVEILSTIKKISNNTKKLYVYRSLSYKTEQELRKRGFDVDSLDSVAAQKDGLYYIINW